ncbi:hypothetical protein TNIN_425391 [Trichonephila inaurata madagascariensis]|uniref:Uncharacterized protein n=1 Tax=Trichonephila inaurata madagascariensis TaxID=2747483 RepID=A0A8X6XL76_9ARAC|nr:hypothetical protein TNIN_425391 [Trichonephila inaurata madagascariensis]
MTILYSVFLVMPCTPFDTVNILLRHGSYVSIEHEDSDLTIDKCSIGIRIVLLRSISPVTNPLIMSTYYKVQSLARDGALIVTNPKMYCSLMTKHMKCQYISG